jgi:hypothetical protein
LGVGLHTRQQQGGQCNVLKGVHACPWVEAEADGFV